jgi:dephospho-CoA kinase
MTGLTGGISTGKSTVVRVIKDRFPQIGIIDCDLLARVVVEPGKPALKQIVGLFGSQVLLPDGTLDRPKLGQIVFNDAVLRRKLTQITSSYIMWEILKQLITLRLRGYSEVVLDAPLLYESKVLAWVCSPVIVVYLADEAAWLNRLMTRDSITEAEAKLKIGSQMPIANKVKLADCLIENSGTLAQLEETAARTLNYLIKL